MNDKLKKLYEIDIELFNSYLKKEDYENALNQIYEEFDGYLGIKTEMDSWTTDEHGLQIPHSKEETIEFYFLIQEEIYRILINKEYSTINNLKTEYERGFEAGKRKGLYKIKELINKLIDD